MDYQDARVLDDLERLARLLDSRWHIPGTRIGIGLDAITGLIPGIGSFATGLVSAYIIWRAGNLGAPTDVIVRMVGNVLIDTIGGSVPVAGNVFDIFFRSNNRNIRLLRRWLDSRGDHAIVVGSGRF
jgi:hypothetical protein